MIDKFIDDDKYSNKNQVFLKRICITIKGQELKLQKLIELKLSLQNKDLVISEDQFNQVNLSLLKHYKNA